jgi:cytochrome P450
MPARQVRDEVVTLFLGAHETSAAAAAWGLHYICSHPPVLSKLRRELAEKLGGASVTASDLRELPYLGAVIKEVLRLHPSIPVISREAIEPCVVGGHHIPKGAQALMTSWAIQRSKRYFDNPEAFLPERWTPDFERALPRFAYFPYGGGHRVCIGQHMAFVELATIFATILQGAELVPANQEAPKPEFGLTMVPQKGALRFRVRKNVLPAATGDTSSFGASSRL